MIQVEVTLQCDADLSLLDLNPETHSAPDLETQWQTWVEQWLTVLNPQFSPIGAYEVSLLLTTDAEIQRLNATYRHQDNPTDVLAFAALEGDGPTLPEWQALPLNLGDIAISVETAARQAQAVGHPLTIELAWLAAHGLLHLLGWDHPDDAQLRQMLSQQAELMQVVGLSPPFYDLGE
ncbi:MAG: rRNA maturation RNase YbeY [Thermosynechococcaceae cyanobacterium]